MAEFPALPLFTDAYLADTKHLTTEEHGAYLLLLMCAWRTRGCFLDDDDKKLSRMVGVSPSKWKRLRPVIASLFTVRDGKWKQKKLTKTYEKVSKKVSALKENAARGGRATALKNQQNLSADGAETEQQIPPNGTRNHNHNHIEEDNNILSSDGIKVDYAELGKELITKHNLSRRIDYLPLKTWLNAGIKPELIRRVVQDVSERAAVSGKVINSFKFFEREMMNTQSMANAAPKKESLADILKKEAKS